MSNTQELFGPNSNYTNLINVTNATNATIPKILRTTTLRPFLYPDRSYNGPQGLIIIFGIVAIVIICMNCIYCSTICKQEDTSPIVRKDTDDF